jgi:NitT/TauT family transport system permease protein
MPIADTRSSADRHAEFSGLDALDFPVTQRSARSRRIWRSLWPKLLASAIFFLGWQCLVWSGWRPEYLLPGPTEVVPTLFDNLDTLIGAAGTTLWRAVEGFLLAIVIGVVIGGFVSRVSVLRAAIGSMITGIQTMPSVAWFPLAIALFKLSEGAILFVVVLGAAPSIANGLISGIDNIPPLLVRAGRALGARGFGAFRHITLPAALPSFVGGLKQGWAFAWRSLLAGELLVLIPGKHSLGEQLEVNRTFGDYRGMLATMMVIFVIGVAADALLFGAADRAIRRRYGLIDQAVTA